MESGVVLKMDFGGNVKIGKAIQNAKFKIKKGRIQNKNLTQEVRKSRKV